ncbi:unnamed protein product [Adineta steineri]|uniref:Uncharacterized protein n=1 Tax=Adineta steineri TaxID=433720 RepID=A0A815BZE7_9BILA|nr:unnamed protein product [Adineta steineri]CAF1280140.1 unnamed protein product [Adineta steineri]
MLTGKLPTKLEHCPVSCSNSVQISTTTASAPILTTTASVLILTTTASAPTSTTTASVPISTTTASAPISTTTASVPVSTTTASVPVSTTTASVTISIPIQDAPCESVTLLPVQSTTPKPPSPPPLPSCPYVLSEMSQSQIIQLINGTSALYVYQHYNNEYQAPLCATVAMIKFEFITNVGRWHLDDVSVKEKYNINEQLIINGDFETGSLDSSWEYCHGIHSWFSGHVTSTTTRTGIYSFESADFGPASHDHLWQTINIKGGTPYIIEFYLLYAGNVGSVKVTVESR